MHTDPPRSWFVRTTLVRASALVALARVVAGTITRLGTRFNVARASTFPGAGQDLSVLGGVAQPGTRDYQAWYRDPALFCTGDAFRLTNGVRVTWAP